MNILVVDDELPAIEGTLTAVEWDKLGFEQVLTAYSSSEAQAVMGEHPVHILLCDIEMPRGSGIDLLRWAKARYPATEAIFLTAHADFAYAKQAVQLGCLEYVLKPVAPEELELVLEKAIHKINQNRESVKYRQYGQFWLQNKPLVVERYWLDILNRAIPSSPEAIRKAAEERSIPYRDDAKVLPILFKVQRWYKPFGLRDEKLMEYALRNAAEETIRRIHPETVVISVDRGVLLAVLDATDGSPAQTALKTSLESYIATCNLYLNCDLSLYVGETTPIAGLTATMDRLHAADKNNVAVMNKVFLPEQRLPLSSRAKLPDFKLWSTMMAEGQKDALRFEIGRYERQMSGDDGIDAAFLTRLHQDFLQTVYYVLQVKGIQAHQLFNDAASLEMSASAVRSVSAMFAWIGHVVHKACSYMADVGQSDTVMGKVKRYIARHIEDELTREEIANHVFLNPDYLTRIVKKETGMPVSEYIQRERMEHAKELLAKTDLSISHIAMQVGYKHFSQFSKIFRKHADMNPGDYRRSHGHKGDA